MTSFHRLLQNAKNLSKSLQRKDIKQRGCFTFFSALIPISEDAIKDATVITTLALNLDSRYDKGLKEYFRESILDLDSFKKQVLIGIYLLKWHQYNSVMNSYFNKPLIDLFRAHLEMSALEDMEDIKLTLCLKALSRYCSYVYHKDDESLNAQLKKMFGVEIQLDIYNASPTSVADNSSWWDCVL
jgi:hypothetical protein